MLSLHQQPGRLRYADNLLPTKEGGMASRPGAIQIVAGDISNGQAWGNRALLEKQGRIVLWDGTGEIDIASAGHGLQASSFQALTVNAQREDRFYIADGVRPLWFIARRAGAYVRETVINSVKDSTGAPYDIPIPQAIASWRTRLWIAFGTNRAQHCQNDKPDQWDPLWTVECQGDEPDRINLLRAHGKTLIAGLGNSLWGVTGDSHLNWQRTPLAAFGTAGPNAFASDESSGYWLSKKGIHHLGTPAPLSEDLREWFKSPIFPGEVALDTRRSLLFVYGLGRLFVMHLDKPGLFGEIRGFRVRGLLQMQDYIGWYGADGAWVLGARDMPDVWKDGTRTDFDSVYETWDDIPNLNGAGRALCQRPTLLAKGSARGNLTYRLIVDEKTENQKIKEKTATLTDQALETWRDDIAGLDGEPWPSAPVRRELPVNVAGTRFRHRLSAPCHLEVLQFDPDYKFGVRKENQ